MMKIQLSEEERKNGRFDPDKLEFAVALLRANGAIIIENVLSTERTEEINEKFSRVLEAFSKNYSYGDGEFSAGGQTKNLRMDLPFEAPFIDSDVVANPFFLDIAEQILGEDLTLRYLASNNSMPGGTKKQPVHSDTGPLFPETYNFTSPTHSLVLHVPLCDFTDLNGATEFYPGGTHHNPDHIYSNPKLIQKLGEYMHFEQAIMPKGSFLIRDKKVWHRGAPNRSELPRGLFTFIYQRAWDSTSGRMPIPQDVYDHMAPRVKELFRMEDISNQYAPMDNVFGLYHIKG